MYIYCYKNRSDEKAIMKVKTSAKRQNTQKDEFEREQHNYTSACFFSTTDSATDSSIHISIDTKMPYWPLDLIVNIVVILDREGLACKLIQVNRGAAVFLHKTTLTFTFLNQF